MTGLKPHKEKPSAKRRSPKPRRAETADRHRLYEKSVQATDFEYTFINDTFKTLRGRTPHRLREDFCGTAQMCCEWVSGRANNVAIGVDLDPEVLAWARANNLEALTPARRKRVELRQDNVLTVAADPVDVLMAMNFSWQVFTSRDELRGYFEKARAALVDDGVFFMDIFGGYEAQREMKEKTRHRGFTYVWDQAHYDPVNSHMTCHIHFHFEDGSKLKRAFTYEWRLWSLVEVRELLREAGFNDVIVYWQGEDKDGEPNGVFEPAQTGDADPAWVCFVAGVK